MINSGWSNRCGTALFSLGWVGCGDVVEPEPPKQKDTFVYVPSIHQTQQNNDLLLMMAQSIFQIID